MHTNVNTIHGKELIMALAAALVQPVNDIHHSSRFTLPFKVVLRTPIQGGPLSPACVYEDHVDLFDPLANRSQAADLCEYYWVSSEIKHDGFWISSIYDINDEPTHMSCAPTKTLAEMRTLLSALTNRD